MAFAASGMYRVATGNAPMYVYKSTDAIATVAASGYFDDFYNELRTGDIVFAVDTDAVTVDMLVVSSADGATTVTTVNGT